MKAHIQQIFYHLIKSSPKLNRLIYKCKCSNSVRIDWNFLLLLFELTRNSSRILNIIQPMNFVLKFSKSTRIYFISIVSNRFLVH